MRRVVITGASSGLGKCIANAMRETWDITSWSLDSGVDVRNTKLMRAAIMDMEDKKQLPVDCLINCAGVNFIEFIPEMQEWSWDFVMDTNAKGIFLATQALLPHLKKGGTILNIISNASHIPMTSSIAYNASKGAAAIMTKQMSRELSKTHGLTVFGVSPNKMPNTSMSRYIDERVMELRGWTREEAQAYQRAALPAGVETPPEMVAEFIAFLLSTPERHRYLAGCDIPYGA